MRIKHGTTRLALAPSCSFAGFPCAPSPDDGCRQANPKPRCGMASRHPRLCRPDHTITQILTVRSRHEHLRSWGSFDSHEWRDLGIPLESAFDEIALGKSLLEPWERFVATR
jgi:hypothetical protein